MDERLIDHFNERAEKSRQNQMRWDALEDQTEAFHALRQTEIDPGRGVEDLPFRERVLYQVVCFTGGHPVGWGYGPTAEDIAEAISDVLARMAEFDVHQEGLQEELLSGSPHWRVRMVAEAAAGLQRLRLVDTSYRWRIRPSDEGCSRVRAWEQVWRERNKPVYERALSYLGGYLQPAVVGGIVSAIVSAAILLFGEGKLHFP